MVQEVEVEEELVEQYQRDGAVLVREVFHPSWVEKVRRGIAKNLDQPSRYSERLLVCPHPARVTIQGTLMVDCANITLNTRF